MKSILTILLSLLYIATFAQKRYVIKPDAQGHISINGTYKPGDTLCISGKPKSVLITNVSGDAVKKILITNVPGETLTMGDSTWSVGSYSYGLMFKNCHQIEVAGSTKSNFRIIGSKSTKLDPNGYPVRTAYFNLRIDDLSDNFIVHDITIRNGGTGVWAKTEVSNSRSATWYPNTYLNNFEFYNLDIAGTYNEGMYVGHTGSYWNITTNQPYYPAPNSATPDQAVYKLPVKLRNVKIHHNVIRDAGNDGIQTAAIDGLEVYNNEVINWGVNKNSSHSGGILIGGRVKGFKAYDNYVHDGWGNIMQIMAEGGGEAVVKNNLLVNTAFGEGVFMRGSNDLIVSFTNNTVLNSPSSLIRINGHYGQKSQQIIKDNILAGTQAKNWLESRNYIYEENEGKYSDLNNAKFKTVVEAKLDSKYLPTSGSPAVGVGYHPPVVEPAKPETVTIAITIPEAALSVGSHTLKFMAPDGKVYNVTVSITKQ